MPNVRAFTFTAFIVPYAPINAYHYLTLARPINQLLTPPMQLGIVVQ